MKHMHIMSCSLNFFCLFLIPPVHSLIILFVYMKREIPKMIWNKYWEHSFWVAGKGLLLVLFCMTSVFSNEPNFFNKNNNTMCENCWMYFSLYNTELKWQVTSSDNVRHIHYCSFAFLDLFLSIITVVMPDNSIRHSYLAYIFCFCTCQNLGIINGSLECIA